LFKWLIMHTTTSLVSNLGILLFLKILWDRWLSSIILLLIFLVSMWHELIVGNILVMWTNNAKKTFAFYISLGSTHYHLIDWYFIIITWSKNILPITTWWNVSQPLPYDGTWSPPTRLYKSLKFSCKNTPILPY
jgi:hypothetical protein